MQAPHPIPYQGSKRKIGSEILRFFPKQSIRLFEPFAGSAAISLAAACQDKAHSFILNDSNAPLMQLWNRIINKPDQIIAAYSKLWNAQQVNKRQYFDKVRSAFNKTQNPEYLLYLLARCVKASVRYNLDGDFNQSPDNRRQGAKPSTMADHIMRASHLLLGRTIIRTGDYQKAISDANEDDLIYLDPPYQGVSGRRNQRYSDTLSFDVFVDSLAEMNRRNLSFIVSYDGKTGAKKHGSQLPISLDMFHIEIDGGVSTQYTLLGRHARTTESLYLSPALAERIYVHDLVARNLQPDQLTLF